jgi:chromosome segregation ATPase
LEKDNKGLRRENTGLLNDKDRMAREKMEALNDKNLTKSGVNALTREIEYLRKQVEAEKANIFSLIRDKDVMKNKISQAEEDNQKNKDNLNKQQNEIS